MGTTRRLVSDTAVSPLSLTATPHARQAFLRGSPRFDLSQSEALFLEEAQASINDGWIIKPSAVGLEFGQSDVQAEGGTVGAMPRHRRDHVGDSQNARSHEDGVTY